MISELLPEEKRRLHDLEMQITQLENGSCSIYPNDVALGLEEMSARLDDLEKMVSRESKVRKDDYRRRVQHLRTTHNHIKNQLTSFLRRKDKENYSSQRRELFKESRGENEEHVSDYAMEMAENGSLDRSGKMLTEYLDTGRETLSELIGQRERLKNVQRKVFDILNYLGISNSIMRAVEGRETVDRYIVFGGMLLITALIFVIWYYRW